MKNYYFDMDGVLANFHKEPEGWKKAMNYDFIFGLDPFMENINVAKELMKKGNRVYISSLAASEDAKRAKIDWLAKYLPEIPKYRIIILVGSRNRNKAEHLKTKTGILIDDKKENCKKWEKAGYEAFWLEQKGMKIEF